MAVTCGAFVANFRIEVYKLSRLRLLGVPKASMEVLFSPNWYPDVIRLWIYVEDITAESQMVHLLTQIPDSFPYASQIVLDVTLLDMRSKSYLRHVLPYTDIRYTNLEVKPSPGNRHLIFLENPAARIRYDLRPGRPSPTASLSDELRLSYAKLQREQMGPPGW